MNNTNLIPNSKLFKKYIKNRKTNTIKSYLKHLNSLFIFFHSQNKSNLFQELLDDNPSPEIYEIINSYLKEKDPTTSSVNYSLT